MRVPADPGEHDDVRRDRRRTPQPLAQSSTWVAIVEEYLAAVDASASGVVSNRTEVDAFSNRRERARAKEKKIFESMSATASRAVPAVGRPQPGDARQAQGMRDAALRRGVLGCAVLQQQEGRRPSERDVPMPCVPLRRGEPHVRLDPTVSGFPFMPAAPRPVEPRVTPRAALRRDVGHLGGCAAYAFHNGSCARQFSGSALQGNHAREWAVAAVDSMATASAPQLMARGADPQHGDRATWRAGLIRELNPACSAAASRSSRFSRAVPPCAGLRRQLTEGRVPRRRTGVSSRPRWRLGDLDARRSRRAEPPEHGGGHGATPRRRRASSTRREIAVQDELLVGPARPRCPARAAARARAQTPSRASQNAMSCASAPSRSTNASSRR